MNRNRCGGCLNFCTDDCKYREHVDTMTFACTSFVDRSIYTLGEDAYQAADYIPGADLERDRWTK